MYTIALIGRTNVGKSTLFNRILGRTKAIVSAESNTTRDRNAGETTWRGVTFRLLDTGGVEELDHHDSTPASARSIEQEIERQVELAINEADLILFVIDTHVGILTGDRAIAKRLHKQGKPIFLVSNKADTPELRIASAEHAALGFGESSIIAAASGVGVGDLLDRIVLGQPIDEEGEVPTQTEASSVRIAIVGEPNVGKSSILNAVLGREEVIVREDPFTTRDAHDVTIEHDGRSITLIDTAGMRRRALQLRRTTKRGTDRVEQRAVRQSVTAIERADVSVLVLDATRSASRHVKQLADAIARRRCACVLVVNKIDLLEHDGNDGELAKFVHSVFPHLNWAPVVVTSAPRSVGVAKILPTALRAYAAWRTTLDGGTLSKIFVTARRRIPSPKSRIGERNLRMIELTQEAVMPPTFRIATRRRVRLPDAIVGIMEREIRATDKFVGTPIVLFVKGMS
jgi:GTPase